MQDVSRGSDGRRLFTAEFKRQQIDRVLRGELTAGVPAEPSTWGRIEAGARQ